MEVFGVRPTHNSTLKSVFPGCHVNRKYSSDVEKQWDVWHFLGERRVKNFQPAYDDEWIGCLVLEHGKSTNYGTKLYSEGLL